MTQQHTITPPPELVRQWEEESLNDPTGAYSQAIANRAAQWAADRQLKADAEWLDQYSLDAPHLTIIPTGKGLVEAMRSKAVKLEAQ